MSDGSHAHCGDSSTSCRIDRLTRASCIAFVLSLLLRLASMSLLSLPLLLVVAVVLLLR